MNRKLTFPTVVGDKRSLIINKSKHGMKHGHRWWSDMENLSLWALGRPVIVPRSLRIKQVLLLELTYWEFYNLTLIT